MTETRAIMDKQDALLLAEYLEGLTMPFTVTVKDGKPKTNPQNKTQRMWMNEAAEQLQTDTAEAFRGYCKLHFGVPILRADDDDFCEKYDAHVRPFSYESKLALMQVPFDFGVTRIMTSKQKTAYLHAVRLHFTGLGVALTIPKDKP